MEARAPLRGRRTIVALALRLGEPMWGGCRVCGQARVQGSPWATPRVLQAPSSGDVCTDRFVVREAFQGASWRCVSASFSPVVVGNVSASATCVVPKCPIVPEALHGLGVAFLVAQQLLGWWEGLPQMHEEERFGLPLLAETVGAPKSRNAACGTLEVWLGCLGMVWLVQNLLGHAQRILAQRVFLARVWSRAPEWRSFEETSRTLRHSESKGGLRARIWAILLVSISDVSCEVLAPCGG